MTLRNQAERAIVSVVESERPLCKVELRVHGEQACCQCCGDSDSDRAEPNRLEIRRCAEHGRYCEREAAWARN
jgi:hypothetical protein